MTPIKPLDCWYIGMCVPIINGMEQTNWYFTVIWYYTAFHVSCQRHGSANLGFVSYLIISVALGAMAARVLLLFAAMGLVADM